MDTPIGSLKRILIVDDEEAILTVLKGSLKKMSAGLEIMTATNGYQALELLRNAPCDVVVTDYKMAGLDGLELLETIRSIQPETRVILMTAYGSGPLEIEAQRLQAYRYLTKPLEVGAFREVVREALNDMAISRPGILILSDERFIKANELLKQLHADVGANYIFLADSNGRLLARTGSRAPADIEPIAALLSGGMATFLEAGRIMDDAPDAINLVYREGTKENLYAINIGPRLLLILFITRGPYSSRLGSVWYYAQQTALALSKTLGEAEFASPRPVLNEGFEQAFDDELDKVWND